MGISKNRGTPKSSSLIGFSIINHPFSGTPIFGNTHISAYKSIHSRAHLLRLRNKLLFHTTSRFSMFLPEGIISCESKNLFILKGMK